MNTFNKMWGLLRQKRPEYYCTAAAEIKGEPQNLEETGHIAGGRDIYEKLIKGYTEKQWGRSCTELPAFIIRRLPVRFTFDNNYFNDRIRESQRGLQRYD
jgi:UDP-galactopyranose mutase